MAQSGSGRIWRLQRLAAAVVLALVCCLVGGAVALALTNEYCGGQLDPTDWCDDGSQHSYYYNRAYHNGSVTVTVCERMLLAGTSTLREPAICGSNYVARDYGPSGCCYVAQVSHRNSGGVPRTVGGLARW